MCTKLRILRVTTVPISLNILLNGQLSFMQRQGFELLAVSAHGDEAASLHQQGILHKAVPMTRKITPGRDVISLFMLLAVIRHFKPHIVHTHTPKAGLLGMVAAWLCRVPVRLHTVAGLPLMECSGLKRQLLLLTEKITYACAHRIYPNSRGIMDFINKNILSSPEKMKVIGNGSTNGIDTIYFNPSEEIEKKADDIRERYGISNRDIVFSFVGRIVKDKGIHELITAFNSLLGIHKNEAQRLFLLLVGPFEQELDPLSKKDHDFLYHHPNVVLAGFQADVRPWIKASDIFVFPSYREGFPNVVMQACCLEVPCIVSDINGCNEIIQHEVSGMIVKPKDVIELSQAMEKLTLNADIRKCYGACAREFVVSNFDQRYVWNCLLEEYRKMLVLHKVSE